MLEVEAALVYRPVRQVSLRAGYAFLSLMPEKSRGSFLDVALGGPFLGLDLLLSSLHN
jgi:hypothetical protein